MAQIHKKSLIILNSSLRSEFNSITWILTNDFARITTPQEHWAGYLMQVPKEIVAKPQKDQRHESLAAGFYQWRLLRGIGAMVHLIFFFLQ